MSGQLGELVVSISADIARFRDDMGRANKVANDTMRQMSTDVSRGMSAVERSMATMGGAVASALSIAAAIGFTKEMANAALAAEKLNMQFKAASGNAQLAAREMGYIKDLSNTLGLNFQTTATAYGKFLASTRNTAIEGETARRVFEGVSKATTALGLSADEANGIFLALSQMMSKGKVSAEELNGQLGERLPGALKLAADSMGMTTAELMKQMQEGKIMSADLLPKLAAELEKTYGKSAEEAAQKGQAGINRFKNEVYETSAAIGNRLLPDINRAAEAMGGFLKILRDRQMGGIGNMLFFEPNNSDLELIKKGVYFPGDYPAGSNSTLDPQQARADYERNQEQARINASRAAAEKAAAGADERAKARKKEQAEAEKAFHAALKEQSEQLTVMTTAQKLYNEQLEYQNKLLDQAVKDWDLKGLGSGLLDNPLQAPKPKNPKFSLTGAAQTMGYGGNDTSQPYDPTKDMQVSAESARQYAEIMAAGDPYKEQLQYLQDYHDQRWAEITKWDDTEVGMAEKKAAALLKIEQDLAKSKRDLNAAYRDETISAAVSLGNQMSNLMMQGSKKQFEQGKALATAMAVVDTAMGVAKAIGSGLPPYNFIMAGLTAAAGAVQIATIQSTQFQAREFGGPVSAGTPYIVGEKRPELFVPNQSGTIVPYVPQGGGGKVEVTQVFQTSAGVSDAINAEIRRAAPYLMKLSIEGVKAAMRNGEFQGVLR